MLTVVPDFGDLFLVVRPPLICGTRDDSISWSREIYVGDLVMFLKVINHKIGPPQHEIFNFGSVGKHPGIFVGHESWLLDECIEL